MGNAVRGDGTTSKQMQEAPKGAIFIWVNAHLWYPKQLAQRLGRTDLKIIAPNQFGSEAQGRNCFVEIDHACVLPQAHYGWMFQNNKRWREKNPGA